VATCCIRALHRRAPSDAVCRLEIAKTFQVPQVVLAPGARLLLLDENMAGLNRKEVETAVALLLLESAGHALLDDPHVRMTYLGV
jgi:hypothetical protein